MKNFIILTFSVLSLVFMYTQMHAQSFDQVWQQHDGGMPTAFANVDLDPNIEILVVDSWNDTFSIYDGVSGSRDFHIPSSTFENIYAAFAVDVNNDGVSEVLLSVEKTPGWDIVVLYSYGSLNVDEDGGEEYGFKPINYPNPFNERTTIRYKVEQENARVLIKIYDQQGKEVQSIDEGNVKKGTHELVWDGNDSNGNRIQSGPYFYNIKIGEEFISNTMIKM